MSRPRKCVVVLVFFGAIWGPVSAEAQRPQGGAGRGGPFPGTIGRLSDDPFQLLRWEQVQQELKLLAEQKEKLRELGERLRSELSEISSGIRRLEGERREQGIAELRKRLQATRNAYRKEVESVLSPHQLKRLKQIHLQLQGNHALSNPEVIQALGITEEQKGKLEAIRDEIRRRIQEIASAVRSIDREEREKKVAEVRQKMRKISEETEKKVMDVLTDEQKKKFAELKGKRIELDRRQLLRK